MTARTTLTFGAVSVLCMLLHNIVMIAGNHVGWGLVPSIIVSFCLVSVTGYLLHSNLTYREKIKATRFARYVLAVSANIPITFITVWVWHDLIGFKMLWASPIATLSMVGVNYVLSRWAIISRNHGFIQ